MVSATFGTTPCALVLLQRMGVAVYDMEEARLAEESAFGVLKGRHRLQVESKCEPKEAWNVLGRNVVVIGVLAKGKGCSIDVENRVNTDCPVITIRLTPGDLVLIPVGLVWRVSETSSDSVHILAPTQNPKRIRVESVAPQCDTNVIANGHPIILNDRAQGLANYPHARVVNGLVYVSGISSRRSDNSHRGVVIGDDGSAAKDIEQQSTAVFENVKWILQQAGSDLQHIVTMTVFLTDIQQHYKGFNQVFNRYFASQHAPARTTVQVAALPHPNLIIEIQCIAAAAPQ